MYDSSFYQGKLHNNADLGEEKKMLNFLIALKISGSSKLQLIHVVRLLAHTHHAQTAPQK